MKRLILSVAASIGLVLLAGCPAPGGQYPDPTGPGAIQEVNDLFVDSGGGAFTFTTNDDAYWGPYGYTLWALKGAAQTPFTSREVDVCKSSGAEFAGFGIVICHYAHPDPNIGETMLVIMINARQQYIVGEVAGAEFQEIVPWTTSSRLLATIGQTNTLRVEYSEATKEFSLFINGDFVKSFTDEEAPFHTQGGNNGYIVVVSPLDDFPAVPVQAMFQEK